MPAMPSSEELAAKALCDALQIPATQGTVFVITEHFASAVRRAHPAPTTADTFVALRDANRNLWYTQEGASKSDYQPGAPLYAHPTAADAGLVERLTAELAAVSQAIGSVEWMDPPDGGSVTLAEQVERMRIALAAAREQRDRAYEIMEQAHDANALAFEDLEQQLAAAREQIARKDAALVHARRVMWEYGFSEDELQLIREALALAAKEMPDGQ